MLTGIVLSQLNSLNICNCNIRTRLLSSFLIPQNWQCKNLSLKPSVVSTARCQLVGFEKKVMQTYCKITACSCTAQTKKRWNMSFLNSKWVMVGIGVWKVFLFWTKAQHRWGIALNQTLVTTRCATYKIRTLINMGDTRIWGNMLWFAEKHCLLFTFTLFSSTNSYFS